jgi:outer membrane protein assembly factor BamD (BamD/ComL family)
MYRIIIVLLVSSFLLQSCNNNSDDSEAIVNIEDINNLEEELFGEMTTTPDMKKAKQLVRSYIIYADQNQDDSLAPELLFKASDISMNISDANATIAIFNRIINNYPNYKNIPTVMFLKGFVYEDQLNDYTNARKYYMEFLDKYPESDFADDALVSINNLGKSPEELIKEFEKKNQ